MSVVGLQLSVQVVVLCPAGCSGILGLRVQLRFRVRFVKACFKGVLVHLILPTSLLLSLPRLWRAEAAKGLGASPGHRGTWPSTASADRN